DDPAVRAVLALSGANIAAGEPCRDGQGDGGNRQRAQRRVRKEGGKPASSPYRQTEIDEDGGDRPDCDLNVSHGYRNEAQPQTSCAVSTTRRSLAACSSWVSALPSTVDEKPHCGDRHNCSSGTYLAASSMRRFRWSLLSRAARLLVTRP